MTANENSELLDSAVFGLLPQHNHRVGSFGASVFINTILGALVLLLSISQVRVLQVRNYQTTSLLFPVKQPRSYIPPAPRIKAIPPLHPIAKPKIELSKPKPTPEPPRPMEMKLPAPMFEAAAPRRVELSPQPKPAPHVQPGAFGDPEGVHANPDALRQPTIAVQGVNFGSGINSGSEGERNRGTVASAGFTNGVVGGAGGTGTRGTVAQAGFGTNQYGSSPALPRRPQELETTPIVVLSKPLPSYTAEARQLKIEGDVTLQVRFTAAGTVEVLRIISGLGHGLDEQAWIAAEHVRFRPATKDGHAVDEISVIHVTFQLA